MVGTAMYDRNFKPQLFADITMPAKLFEAQILAPIKRPLSRENTPPSQKRIFFLQGHHPVRDQSLVVACIRVFKIYWCGFLFDLLPGTHQDQGQ